VFHHNLLTIGIAEFTPLILPLQYILWKTLADLIKMRHNNKYIQFGNPVTPMRVPASINQDDMYPQGGAQ